MDKALIINIACYVVGFIGGIVMGYIISQKEKKDLKKCKRITIIRGKEL